MASFQGLAALLKSGSFCAKSAQLPLRDEYDDAGRIVLIAGIIVFLVELAVMSGALCARIVGIILALLSALANIIRPYA